MPVPLVNSSAGQVIAVGESVQGLKVGELHTLPVKVWIILDYFHLDIHKAAIEDFSDIPILDLRAPALNDYQRMMKHAFDLLVSILMLPPVLILMGVVSIAIRMEGSGPVLFRQKRAGENGRIFEMLKFRTMVPGAETMVDLVERLDEEGHLIHKSDRDPRVTPVGGFLRCTSLDELPQLFNVFKGGYEPGRSQTGIAVPGRKVPTLAAETLRYTTRHDRMVADQRSQR